METQSELDCNGYAYIARCNKHVPINSIPNDKWEIEILRADDREYTKFVGVRMIDGALVNVWRHHQRQAYIAQRKV